jgi:uncharacterized protein YggE
MNAGMNAGWSTSNKETVDPYGNGGVLRTITVSVEVDDDRILVDEARRAAVRAIVHEMAARVAAALGVGAEDIVDRS